MTFPWRQPPVALDGRRADTRIGHDGSARRTDMKIGPPDYPPVDPALRCLIIVPAFNERQSVARLARRLHRAMPSADVLVIDDGSTDDTLRRVPPATKVISLPFNLGIGGAMQTGYRYAALHGYDVAVQVDGDGQHRPGEVPRLVQHLLRSGADLAVGSRFIGKNREVPKHRRYHQSIPRMVGIHILDAVIRLLCGLRVTDCTSGFRVANRRVIRAFAHWYPDDYPEPEVGAAAAPRRVPHHRAGRPHAAAAGGDDQHSAPARDLLRAQGGAGPGAGHGPRPLADRQGDRRRLRKRPMPNLLRTLILLAFGSTLLLLAVRRLRRFRLKERYALLFVLLGLPFLVLAVWPRGIELLSELTRIAQPTVMLLCVSVFLILSVFELLTIVSVQDRKITTLAQMVGILMEHQRLVDREHAGITPKDEPGPRAVAAGDR